MTLFLPCIRSIGPKDAKIAFVGEAPGETEEQTGLPFMGKAGQELTSMLEEVGIKRKDCFLTNVLFTRPRDNKLENLLVKKEEIPSGYSLSPMAQGKYLPPDLFPEIERLRNELLTFQAGGGNLCVALGNTALWALTGSAAISSARGTVSTSILIPGLKVLPTYHPAGVLRNWSWRVIVLQDLTKAKREMEFPEIRRTRRKLLIDPTAQEAIQWLAAALYSPVLSCDIETEKKQITSIGFATSPEEGLVIPFWDKRKPSWSYWDDETVECAIWHNIKWLLLQHPKVLFQNGLFDVQYLWKMGIRIPGFLEDTMILHHAMYPELPKGLGFLGSIYINDSAWKKMRARHGSQDVKREE